MSFQEQVVEHLNQLQLSDYIDKLLEAGYDRLSDLESATVDDLVEVGMKEQHALRLIKSVEVRAHLCQHQLGDYADKLLEAGYDRLSDLAHASVDDLVAVGMKKPHAMRLIKSLSRDAPAAPAAAAPSSSSSSRPYSSSALPLEDVDVLIGVNKVDPKHVVAFQKYGIAEKVRELTSKPVQLIAGDYGSLKFMVKKEGADLLRSIKNDVVVIACASSVHSGKSYLLNRLFGSTSGFDSGPARHEQANGLWLWKGPTIEWDDGRERTFLLINCESMGAVVFDGKTLPFPERLAPSNFKAVSPEYDARLFAISMLLSSYFMLNSKNVADTETLDKLKGLAQLSRYVAPEVGKEGEFPRLMWVLRDVFLDIGRDADKYINGVVNDDKAQVSVQVLRDMFSKIGGFAMPTPVDQRCCLEDVPIEQVRPQFNEFIELLQQRVFGEAQPKQRKSKNGQARVSGAELADLLEHYVAAVNSARASGKGSRARGAGLTAAKQGDEAQFSVVACNVDGVPLGHGGVAVAARLVSVAHADAAPVVCRVQTNSDGVTQCAYTPTHAGEHRLEVSIDDEPVSGSPWTVQVAMSSAEAAMTAKEAGKAAAAAAPAPVAAAAPAEAKKTKAQIEDDAKSMAGSVDIHHAALAGDVAKVEALVKENAALVHAQNDDSRTPLYLAALGGSAPVVALLLARGANANEKTRSGWSPLAAASDRGHADVVRVLGAAPGVNVESINADGTTALFHAACAGHTDVCRVLIEEARANVNGGTAGGWTALQGAVFYTHPDTIDYLLSVAGVDVNVPNDLVMKSYTALHLAVGRKLAFERAITALLAHKDIKVDVPNKNGATALHLCALWGHVGAAHQLVAAGADPCAKTKKGKTPLETAVNEDKRDVAQYLAELTGVPMPAAGTSPAKIKISKGVGVKRPDGTPSE
jgi:ankyrin repeat protein